MKTIMAVLALLALIAGTAAAEDRDDNDDRRDRRDDNVMILNPDSGEVSPGRRLGRPGAPVLDLNTGRVIVPAPPAGPGMVLDLENK